MPGGRDGRGLVREVARQDIVRVLVLLAAHGWHVLEELVLILLLEYVIAVFL